ncbi:MAG: biotin/lipoyl-binding carrier protein [Xanthobacteraceae bacterium]
MLLARSGSLSSHSQTLSPRLLGISPTFERRRPEFRAGSIWKIVRTTGDKVAEGDPIMIMESMKMEIPVIASEEGTIKEISVSEGDVVQEGTVLAILDI